MERLRADPEQWVAYRAESAALESTLMDGLDPDEVRQFLAAAQPNEIQFLERPDLHNTQPR